MTPESKQELLKNCQVTRVQKEENWAEPVEDAVRAELRQVIASWLKAANTEGIGPKEVVAYLEDINDYIGIAVVPQELPKSPATDPGNLQVGV